MIFVATREAMPSRNSRTEISALVKEEVSVKLIKKYNVWLRSWRLPITERI